MSLIGLNEHGTGTPWKLNHVSQSDGSFETNYRVCNGADGTGDIYKWENVLALATTIQGELQASGVVADKSNNAHLVVSDGGFDAQRDSEYQEELARKLVISEMAAGVYLLRTGGTLIIKMFGFQTASIRTAMQSLYDMFSELQVLKPISSRPASSERYVVFSGFRGLPDSWDGPSWMSRVFLGSATSRPPASYLPLNSFLDGIDADIVSLNLKACFAILSSLDRKGTAMYAESNGNSHDDERAPVNVPSYKAAWRLH